jgi:very-short-patch-repair endonuclease
MGSLCFYLVHQIRYGGKMKKLTTKEFITKAKLVHGDKYVYDLTKYIVNSKKVTITCQTHGNFQQIPNSHLNGNGCHECGRILTDTKRLYSTSDVIEKANLVHNYRYSYDKLVYVKSKEKGIITCNIHGDFSQKMSHHLCGIGCPSCRFSKGETKIHNWLSSNNIQFIPQYKFEDCKNIRKLLFDFYLPSQNLCIEYDGEQHFKQKEYTGKKCNLEYIQKNDSIKNLFCESNGIELLRIPYNKYRKIEEILKATVSL